jgi:arsenate reductase
VFADNELCVCELEDILQRPQYAVSRALGALRRAGLVTEHRDGKLVYYNLAHGPFNDRLFAALEAIPTDEETARIDRDRTRWRLDIRVRGSCVVTTRNRNARATGGWNMSDGKGRVLFVCVHNSARSQMAEEYLRRFAGDLLEVESAGLEPGELNPYVVRVLEEDGIHISGKETHSVANYYQEGRTYEYVITVCSREAEEKCPVFPGPVRRLNWPFPDPAAFTGSEEEILSQTRKIRDRVRRQVREFADAYRRSHEEEA